MERTGMASQAGSSLKVREDQEQGKVPLGALGGAYGESDPSSAPLTYTVEKELRRSMQRTQQLQMASQFLASEGAEALVTNLKNLQKLGLFLP